MIEPQSPPTLASLLIRADGNERIGAGHIIRCLSLAEAWSEVGGSVHFVCRAGLAPRLQERITKLGIACTLLPSETLLQDEPAAILQLAETIDAAWIVLDSYDFDPAYQRAVQGAGRQVLVIDDNARWPRYHADALLNQNPDAERLSYEGGAAMHRMLGNLYALVAASFRQAREGQREFPDRAQRILVTMGGADPANLTPTVLAAIGQLPGPLDVRVLVGPAKLQADTNHDVATTGPHRVEFVVDSPNVAEQFAWADLAVSAAGSTCWELATVGVPTVVIPAADNQQAIAKELAALGVVINATAEQETLVETLAMLISDRERRRTLSLRGRELIDGLGPSRVVSELSRQTLRLRAATPDDARLVWQWANDSETRLASFRPHKIAWQEHATWFASKLADSDCTLLLAVDVRGKPLGIARYERAGREVVMSINIAPTQRGTGHGGRLARLSARHVFHRLPVDTRVELVRAYVKPENKRSQQMFEKAGFYRDDDSNVADQPAMTWVLRRDDL